MLLLIYENLIKCGVHIGHTRFNTLFMAAWILYFNREDTWIINLFKTIYMFKIAFKCLKMIISQNGPVWFINLDETMEAFVKFNANKCGEFFICSNWINGMISNFKKIQKHFKISLEKVILTNYKKKYKFLYDNWKFTRFTWPRFIFVSNVKNSAPVVREASVSNVYCLGIIDTNVKSQGLNLPIPGNDESVDSLLFYNELICNYILIWKFKNVIIWLGNIRGIDRIRKNYKNFYNFAFNIRKNYKNFYNFPSNLDKEGILFALASKFIFINSKEFINVNVRKINYNCFNNFNVDIMHIIFQQNRRLIFLLSRLYLLRNKFRRNSFFRSNLTKLQARSKFVFNFYFGIFNLRYLKYILKWKYFGYIRNIYFDRFFSSYALRYMSLFCSVYKYFKHRSEGKLKKKYLEYLKNLEKFFKFKDVKFLKNFKYIKNLTSLNLNHFNHFKNVKNFLHLQKSFNLTHIWTFRFFRRFFYFKKLKWIPNLNKKKSFKKKRQYFAAKSSLYSAILNIYKNVLFYYLYSSWKKFKNNVFKFQNKVTLFKNFKFRPKIKIFKFGPKQFLELKNLKLGFWAFNKITSDFFRLKNKVLNTSKNDKKNLKINYNDEYSELIFGSKTFQKNFYIKYIVSKRKLCSKGLYFKRKFYDKDKGRQFGWVVDKKYLDHFFENKDLERVIYYRWKKLKYIYII